MTLKAYSFFHRQSGEFADRVFFSDDDRAVLMNTPEDFVAIEGHFNHVIHVFDHATHKVIERAPGAPPHPDLQWNAEGKCWALTEAGMVRQQARRRIQELESQQARAVREALLGRGGFSELQKIDDEIAQLRAKLI